MGERLIANASAQIPDIAAPMLAVSECRRWLQRAARAWRTWRYDLNSLLIRVGRKMIVADVRSAFCLALNRYRPMSSSARLKKVRPTGTAASLAYTGNLIAHCPLLSIVHE